MLATVLVHPCAQLLRTQFILHTSPRSSGWTWLATIFGNVSGKMMLWSRESILCTLFQFYSTNFRSDSYSDGKQFIRYFAYVWGLSIVCTTFAYSFDIIEAIPSYLKPGFGTERCFLKGVSPSPLSIRSLHFDKFFSIFRNTTVQVFILLLAHLHHLHNECCIFDFNCDGNSSSPTTSR